MMKVCLPLSARLRRNIKHTFLFIFSFFLHLRFSLFSFNLPHHHSLSNSQLVSFAFSLVNLSTPRVHSAAVRNSRSKFRLIMDARQRILGEVDAANLQNQGLLGPPDSRGTRKLHRRYLNRLSDQEYKHIPLDVPMNSPAADEAFVSIPEHLISQATLEYVGFSTAKAAAMWLQWTNWPEDGPRREDDDVDDGGLCITFLDYFTRPFNGSTDCFSEDDNEWSRCMDEFGLSSQVQDKILDPVFKYLRLSDSCAFWAKDTVEMRYAGLRNIQQASRERERMLLSGEGVQRPAPSGTNIAPSQ